MSNDSLSDKNKIVFNGKEMELNTLSGTVGPSVVDIRSLYGDLGIFTYDPGYGSTGSCESGITFIDGEKGILLHRGYPIDQLAEQSSFLEVAYLLLNGDLPKIISISCWIISLSIGSFVVSNNCINCVTLFAPPANISLGVPPSVA